MLLIVLVSTSVGVYTFSSHHNPVWTKIFVFLLSRIPRGALIRKVSIPRVWIFGPILCKVNNFVALLSVSLSVFTLLAISLDRRTVSYKIEFPLIVTLVPTPSNLFRSSWLRLPGVDVITNQRSPINVICSCFVQKEGRNLCPGHYPRHLVDERGPGLTLHCFFSGNQIWRVI